MRRKTVYSSKLDTKLKKPKKALKAKLTHPRGYVRNGSDFVLTHKDYPHFCPSCDIPQ
jgi:hypothetical protein